MATRHDRIIRSRVEQDGVVYDTVSRPEHYTSGKIECIDAIEEAIKDLTGIEAKCTGDAIKYLWRWKKKNGLEDLKKAQWYINHLISKQK